MDVVLLSILGMAAYFDYKERIVPNKLIYSGLVIGALMAVLQKEYNKIFAAIFIFLLLYLLFYKFRVLLPGGDIKALTFIVIAKGYDFFIQSLYFIIIFLIPLWIFYAIKEKRENEKQIIPLVVPMLLGCSFIVLRGIINVKVF